MLLSYWRLYNAPLLWCLDVDEYVIWTTYVVYPVGQNGKD